MTSAFTNLLHKLILHIWFYSGKAIVIFGKYFKAYKFTFILSAALNFSKLILFFLLHLYQWNLCQSNKLTKIYECHNNYVPSLLINFKLKKRKEWFIHIRLCFLFRYRKKQKSGENSGPVCMKFNYQCLMIFTPEQETVLAYWI